MFNLFLSKGKKKFLKNFHKISHMLKIGPTQKKQSEGVRFY